MKVVLLGASLSSGNRGVNALTKGTINTLISEKGVKDIVILSYSTNVEITHYVDNIEIREIPFHAKRRLLDLIMLSLKIKKVSQLKKTKCTKYILESDYILDISEGDSFSDIYGYKRFILNIIGKKIAIISKKKLVIMPQTIGPFNNKLVHKIAQDILCKCKYIFTRDMISFNLAKIMNENSYNIMWSPDMAFYMKPKEVEELQINKDKYELIGLNISALLYNGGYNKKNMFGFKVEYDILIDEIIKEIASNKKNKILLIPHVISNIDIENDLEVSIKVYERYKDILGDRIEVINIPYDADEIKYIISKCDLFIGSRMHACIAAVSTNIPTMPIAYSRKFIGIWELLNMNKYVADPREQDLRSIVSIFNMLYEDKVEIVKQLQDKNNIYKNLIGELYEKMC